MQRWQCRIAPSLGDGFAGHPNDVWGTQKYIDFGDTPTVFFGMYGLPDFYTLWRHKGRKAILWAGSDIIHLYNGYWLDDKGDIKIRHSSIAEWIEENCENYCENKVEQEKLKDCGITAKVVPSFLGNVDDFQPQKIEPNKYYTSVSGDDFELYGWDEIDDWARKMPGCEFHLYGNREQWISEEKNVFVHGRMSQQDMDAQIKTMTGAIRLTRFDGASEILIKSLLWCQNPVSPYIFYPDISQSIQQSLLKSRKDDKIEIRNRWKDFLNNYPWNIHKKQERK